MTPRSPRPFTVTVAAVASGALLAAGLPATAGAAERAAPVAPAQSSANGAAQVDAPVPDIDWQPCDDAGGFDCAEIQVPSDYDRPHGRTTTIALTRLPATDTENRIGSALVNFGGPGGPGVETLHLVGETMVDPEVRARFDLVSFDPRGVGQSDPVTCFRDAEREEQFLAGLPEMPITRSDQRRIVAGFARIATGCQVVSGQRLATASTANVARDMDVLRQALGDEQLTYIGYSYGTILGATYSALFPERVRALVLDGTIDPVAWSGKGSPDPIATRLGQPEATVETFAEFNRLCAEAGPASCSLAALGDPADVTEEVLTTLREGPVEVPDGDGGTVAVTYGQMVSASYTAMYGTAQWPDLALAFTQVAVAAGIGEQPPSARAQGRSLDDLLRELGVVEDYPSLGSSLAAQCMDTAEPLPLWRYPAYVDDLDEEYPHFGLLRGWTGAACAATVLRDEDAYTGPWGQTTQAPVMVIGTRHDPATPYRFTAPYADHYDDARVMTVEGWGHTTLGASTCADAAIARYLVDGEADDGATCTQDITPFAAAAQRSDREDLRTLVGRSAWWGA
ncbi:alpha/beta hydrolase [Isoptericola halotolerans]|uniref:Pimeloyl-ACP methyl ester carboxylesterase n=1 Tax=Isoptericola halotolerans TaxID=300560 RepID=A0ABX2A4B0_9MICO|nr:alpha/beta fold hydrolase [Isoptericola halotolerans]NOV96753.1 pimeloyl-ACP methyl ester carboxylesterase [Isoptericola halotolerans]